ncbi:MULTISPECIES: PHP domain-containing protein [unclassified Actinotalea]|uniref:PHP domain-containing protein n=1 Tax=unclassified Actinotalea TaxID=2638618 RepID=UPI0015F4A11D|nr:MULTISPECIES: PHP domain-containing protein [unclassified Actinotalea]
MRIDLHTHSVASDGTDAPGELVAAAAAAGLDVVALTDHDTTRGWAEAEAAVPRHGVALVRGAEVSCLVDGRMSVHLLSYLHDPTHPGLLAEAERTREARLQRARAMVDLIAADLDLTWDDVEAQTVPGTTVGRPHIADALAAKGHVPDRSAAFATVLAVGSPYYVPHYAPDAETAVRLVRAAGGVPVLAHPGAHVRGRILSDDAIGRLVDAGLLGLEVDHRDHDESQRRRLAGIAADAGLLVTGSSDYHGAGKPNLLGEFTTSPEVLEAIEARGLLPVVRP